MSERQGAHRHCGEEKKKHRAAAPITMATREKEKKWKISSRFEISDIVLSHLVAVPEEREG